MKKHLGLGNVLLMLVVLVLAGCATTGGPEETADEGQAEALTSPATAPAQQSKQAQSEEAGGAESFAAEAPEPVVMDPLQDPGSPLAQRTIYFDFDRSTVRDEYLDLIKSHGEYLLEHPDRLVTLEGHADERGSREYNLALGEERAKAVRDLLMLQGVSGDQISIVSYGEERPADSGHDETAWQHNRRVVIVY